MKNAFKKWFTYLIALGLCGIASAASLIPYFTINDLKSWPAAYISYSYLLSGVVIVGVGFIVQDIFRALKRKETKNWEGPLEEKHINKAWLIFGPCLLSGLTCILLGLILYPFIR